MEKTNRVLTVPVSDADLRRIERIVEVERTTANQWAQRVLSYVAQRVGRVHGEER